MVSEVAKNDSVTSGFDAAVGEYSDDMIARGIIDPVKVVRTALEDASSVAALLTTSECMVVDIPEPAAAAPPMGGGMPGMGGMGGMGF